MTLSTASRLLSKASLLTAITAAALAFAGCDSWIYDDEGDCSVRYYVPITFTESYDGGNAVVGQVRSVTLYVVDGQGNVVSTQSADIPRGEATEGYAMEVDVAPGTYDLLVWGQGESPMDVNTAYAIGSGTQLDQLNATLPLSGTDGALYCNRDIVPLFNGLRRNVEFPDTYGDITVDPVNLTRDTHVFQVLLQTSDGSPLRPDEVTIGIEADNSVIAYDNAVTPGTPFTYYPWQITSTSASFDTPDVAPASRADGEPNGLLGELTTGRLMAGSSPRLVVRRESDGRAVISINLLSYLLLVKGEYNRNITDQQYLDRMRTFTLMFFLDEGRNWYMAGGIFINGWRVVPPQDMEL